MAIDPVHGPRGRLTRVSAPTVACPLRRHRHVQGPVCRMGRVRLRLQLQDAQHDRGERPLRCDDDLVRLPCLGIGVSAQARGGAGLTARRGSQSTSARPRRRLAAIDSTRPSIRMGHRSGTMPLKCTCAVFIAARGRAPGRAARVARLTLTRSYPRASRDCETYNL